MFSSFRGIIESPYLFFFGTVDSFLVYKLTGGNSFVTDVTNASRTMLMNINTLAYDEELLEIFGIPRDSLPQIVDCDATVGYFNYGGVNVPICGIAGDQQAALIGQGCFTSGSGKVTYGTGLFMLYNLADKAVISDNGLVTTVGYTIGGKTAYAFEGSVFNAGSAVQWIRDNLNLIKESAESEKAALSVEDNGGVYFVPAFTGLGAPYWDSEARGTIVGLTRSSTKNHIIRATLESMAYSCRDLAEVMQKESGIAMAEIRCDGGASANDFLMQFQANVIGADVNRPEEKESTALGAAYLAGLGVGYYSDLDQIRADWRPDRKFSPTMSEEKREELLRGWHRAVERSLRWSESN